MRLLVTGASGFVGSHVARAASERGNYVRCLVRASSDLSPLRALAVDLVPGDVTDKDSVRTAAAGIDSVVHCAAATSETAPDPAVSHRINVLGTQNLVEACAENRLDRLVLLSSQSATASNASAYGRTKLEAERIAAASGLRFTILRPSTVYGPGARGLFAKMARYVSRLPLVPVIGNGRQRFRPIYVGDLVTAILRCLESKEAIGKTYDLGGLDGVSFEQFIDGVGEVLGRKRAKVRVPIPICLGLARTLALLAKNPPLTVDNIIGITQMSECDISKAQQDFGFQPVTFKDGLRLLRAQGMGL
jgi:nucleoside-diphosphate-sugar epimerase